MWYYNYITTFDMEAKVEQLAEQYHEYNRPFADTYSTSRQLELMCEASMRLYGGLSVPTDIPGLETAYKLAEIHREIQTTVEPADAKERDRLMKKVHKILLRP
jgi:hypothetical protein